MSLSQKTSPLKGRVVELRDKLLERPEAAMEIMASAGPETSSLLFAALDGLMHHCDQLSVILLLSKLLLSYPSARR